MFTNGYRRTRHVLAPGAHELALEPGFAVELVVPADVELPWPHEDIPLELWLTSSEDRERNAAPSARARLGRDGRARLIVPGAGLYWVTWRVGSLGYLSLGTESVNESTPHELVPGRTGPIILDPDREELAAAFATVRAGD